MQTHVMEPPWRARRPRGLGWRLVTIVSIAALAPLALLVPRHATRLTVAGAPTAQKDDQVRAAIATLFEPGPTLQDKMTQLDDSTGLEPVVSQGMRDDRAPRLTLTVTEVDLEDPMATAHIDFFLDGALAMTDARLVLGRQGDRWLVQRDSYCALIATGGLDCPREPTTSRPA